MGIKVHTSEKVLDRVGEMRTKDVLAHSSALNPNKAHFIRIVFGFQTDKARMRKKKNYT